MPRPRAGHRDKVDQTRHTLEAHPLDQRVEQLTAHDRRPVLHLDQIVQCVRNGVHGVVPERVVACLALRVVAGAGERRAGVAAMVLRPQVGAAGVVCLEAAAAILVHHGRQLTSPC
eukprot:153129-Prymnesium_polylepis.2